MKDFHRQIIDWLNANGATDVRYQQTNNHPRVVFIWNGRERFYVMPGTPGDTMRAIKNATHDLRRMLGLTPTQKRIGQRRERKDKIRTDHLDLPTITPGKNWQAALLRHPAAKLDARLDAAFLSLWRECMKGESRI